jgi:tetratricopeptide (TPR) repeat protein
LLVLADQHYQAEEFFAAGYPMIEKLEIDTEDRLWLREREILILNHLGKTDEVIARCEEMLRGEEAMTLYPKLRVELLDNLAHAHSRNGHYEEAERVLRITISEYENIYGHDSIEVAAPLNSLATNLTMQGRYEQAEAYLTMLVERAMERFGGGNPQTANAMMQLASCRLRAGKLDGLVEELIHAQAIFTHSLGPKHYLTCVCRMRMASVKLQLNEIESARSISMDVVEIMTEKYPEHADTTNWAITLGYTYYMEDDYASAIPYYEKYLPRFKELLGPENPVVQRAYNRLKEMQEKLDSAGVQALSKAS